MTDAVDGDVLIMDLAVAHAALRKMRKLIEDNASAEEPKDAATLRQVFSLMLDASSGVAGAVAVLKLRDEMREAVARTNRTALRLVK